MGCQMVQTKKPHSWLPPLWPPQWRHWPHPTMYKPRFADIVGFCNHATPQTPPWKWHRPRYNRRSECWNWHTEMAGNPPLAIKPAGQAQAILNWQNLVHGFLSPTWKLQQAIYYNNCRNPSSATTWAANLLHLILKNAHQQWDWNRVLHQLQPNWVKDLVLDIEIQQQYDSGCASLSIASQTLLNWPLPTTLSLPHNEKHKKKIWLKVLSLGVMLEAWKTHTTTQWKTPMAYIHQSCMTMPMLCQG